MARAAVFLDRDGVLIAGATVDGMPHPLPEGEADILPGVEEACLCLREAGFVLIGVSNQPDIARGTSSAEAVAQTNSELQNRLGLDALLVCPHDDADDCECRKPRPGLLLTGAQLFDVDLACSVMIGDRWRDIEAGKRAGCATIFVDRGYRERRPVDPDHTVPNLPDAVPYVIAMAAPVAGRTDQVV